MTAAAVFKSIALGILTSRRAGTAAYSAYEPSTIGVTRDSDDRGFMDVTLSLQLPLVDFGGASDADCRGLIAEASANVQAKALTRRPVTSP